MAKAVIPLAALRPLLGSVAEAKLRGFIEERVLVDQTAPLSPS